MFRGLEEHEIENIVSQILDTGSETEEGELAERGVIEVLGEVSPGEFRTFEFKEEKFRMLAVDGGSAAILDAGSFVVAGVRVGQVLFEDGKMQREASGTPEMHVFHLSLGSLRRAYSIFYEKTVGGKPPDCPKGLEEGVGRIRTLLEWKRVEEALAGDLSAGSVLAFDGALWAGIKGIDDMLRRIVMTAKEKNIVLCAISKRSMLTHGGYPLIPKVQLLGEGALPGKTWFLPLTIDQKYADKEFGQVFVARLHNRARHVFRVDMAIPDGTSIEEAFGKLAQLSNDPAYVGYPYPLARVHNDVAFTRSEIEELRHMMMRAAIRKGMDPKEWHLTFQEFHQVLDMSR